MPHNVPVLAPGKSFVDIFITWSFEPKLIILIKDEKLHNNRDELFSVNLACTIIFWQKPIYLILNSFLCIDIYIDSPTYNH